MAPRTIKKSSSKSSKSYGLLWLITGILLGVFIASLSFLKKNVPVTESNNSAAVKEHSFFHTRTTTNNNLVKNTKETSAKAVNAQDNEHYDFYTMLPKMQVDQQNLDDAKPAATTKPTKPLALAEQNMLTPQQASTTSTSATPVSTATAATPTQVPTVLPQGAANNMTSNAVSKLTTTATPNHYRVNLGSFSSYNQADARKAELLMNGIDTAKVESYQTNGATAYRVVVGPFSSKDEAAAQLSKLQQNSVSGTIEAAN